MIKDPLNNLAMDKHLGSENTDGEGEKLVFRINSEPLTIIITRSSFFCQEESYSQPAGNRYLAAKIGQSGIRPSVKIGKRPQAVTPQQPENLLTSENCTRYSYRAPSKVVESKVQHIPSVLGRYRENHWKKMQKLWNRTLAARIFNRRTGFDARRSNLVLRIR